MTRREACLVLNLLPGIGPVRARRLIEALESPEAVLQAKPQILQQVEGIGAELAAVIARWEAHVDLSRELRRIQEVGAQVLIAEDDVFPKGLRQIPDAPLVLYVWGEVLPRDAHAIAVVGSRRATPYGLQAAKKLSFQLAHCGMTVLSGLARGIDTAAHEGALAAQGRTIAVLGSGLAKLYPPENQALAERIADGHGAVVSEFPIDYNPDRQSFPLRNRIVAGWSQGVLVVEAPYRSGSLITAHQAGEYGRALYAVPGPIDRPTSHGCNKLIQDGARLVMSAEDIFEDQSWLLPPAHRTAEVAATPVSNPAATQLGGEEKVLYELLANGSQQFEELAEASGLPAATLTVMLMKLEMKRLIKQRPGRFYERMA